MILPAYSIMMVYSAAGYEWVIQRLNDKNYFSLNSIKSKHIEYDLYHCLTKLFFLNFDGVKVIRLRKENYNLRFTLLVNTKVSGYLSVVAAQWN